MPKIFKPNFLWFCHSQDQIFQNSVFIFFAKKECLFQESILRTWLKLWDTRTRNGNWTFRIIQALFLHPVKSYKFNDHQGYNLPETYPTANTSLFVLYFRLPIKILSKIYALWSMNFILQIRKVRQVPELYQLKVALVAVEFLGS